MICLLFVFSENQESQSGIACFDGSRVNELSFGVYPATPSVWTTHFGAFPGSLPIGCHLPFSGPLSSFHSSAVDKFQSRT